jgi:predicted Zn-dependent peptidase
MKSPNRTIAPPIKGTSFPSFIAPPTTLYDGVNCTYLETIEPISRIDLVFNHGLMQQSEKLQLDATMNLLLAGTNELNQGEILQKLDYLGAFTDVGTENNHSYITLYSTPDLVDESFRFICQIIAGANFPEDKIETYKQQKRSQLKQNHEKTSYLASTQVKQCFYEDSVISRPLTNNHIEKIDSQVLQKTKGDFLKSVCHVYVTGSKNSSDSILKIFSEHFRAGSISNNSYPKLRNKSISQHIVHRQAVQTSFRMRLPSISKVHEDYAEILLCNAMLGGYFGSQLMQNIREDKGLTYGISSQFVSNQNYGFIHISSEIKHDSIQTVQDSIVLEINKLRNGEISGAHFNKTVAYLKGILSKKEDELFTRLEKTQIINNQTLVPEFYSNLYKSIDSSNLKKCINAAQKHLNYTKAVVITCGSEQYDATSSV